MSRELAPSSLPADRRFYALDALRAWAMLWGVAFHAAISYMHGQMPGLLWGVYDTTRSSLFDGVFWWIHGFHLHLFFLISGFTAVMVYESRGPLGFLRQRAHRILLPFGLSVAVILTATLYIWGVGWFLSGRCTLRELTRTNFPPEIRSQLWGPAHLWFLEELFVMSVAFAGVYALVKRFSRRECVTDTLTTRVPGWFHPLALSVPTALFLWLEPSPVMVHANSFIPNLPRMAYYGLFFAGGAWLYRYRHALVDFVPRGPLWLAISAPALAVVLWLVPNDLRVEVIGWQRVALSAAIALLAWTSVLGFLGVFVKRLSWPNPVVRYLADASYWIYLSHFPLVGLAQVALYKAPLPAAVKFMLTVAVATSLCLASYHTLVRYTWIGTLLHGRRSRPVSLASGWREHEAQELQQQKAA